MQAHTPFLAYLSACGTGQAKDKWLTTESLHLIGGFQLAGFPHVIGTLWEVNDASCVDMARLTYERIQHDGLTDTAVCRGLHDAMRHMRGQWLRANLPRIVRKWSPEHLKGDISERNAIRDVRHGKMIEDDYSVMHWVPYIHHGA